MGDSEMPEQERELRAADAAEEPGRDSAAGRGRAVHHRKWWVYAVYAFLVVLAARKPDEWVLADGRVSGGRIDVTTVARRLFDPTAPAMDPDAHRPLASLLIVETARVPGVDDLTTSYTLWRIACLFATVVLLDGLMRRWLMPGGAFGAVVLYLLGMVHAGFDDKPDGWFEQFFYAAGLSAIAAGQAWWLAPILAVGTWARESVVFLVAAHFLVAARRGSWTRAFVHCSLLLGVWCLSWGIVHYLVGDTRYYSELWRLPRNVVGVLNYLRHPWGVNMRQYLLVGIFGALWVLPYLRRPRGPDFLERVKWLLPLSLLFTVQLAKLWEVRVFYYHMMYLAPLALWKLFPDLRRPDP